MLLITGLACTCQTSIEIPKPADHVYIPQFPEDKEAAISFTFDDNCPSSLSTIVLTLDKYGYKATFFVIPNRIGSDERWKKWKKLDYEGHEIGNHSLNHQNLSKIQDIELLRNEINMAQDIIHKKIGKAPFSFAHPGHATNDMVDRIMFERHYASRMSPAKFCNWWGVVSISTVDAFENFMNDGIKTKAWMVIAAHGVGDGWKPISQNFFNQSLSLVNANEDKIYVDHFGNLARYKIERQETKIIANEFENKLLITLDSQIDTTVFNYPLTVVVANPKFKDGKITALEGSNIIGIMYKQDKILIKVLPKSKIQIQNHWKPSKK